jgi:putative transposase
MAQHGIRARHKRKYVATTNSNHDLPVAPNLLERNFTATAPNQLWTSDITYLRLDRDSLEIRHISV